MHIVTACPTEWLIKTVVCDFHTVWFVTLFTDGFRNDYFYIVPFSRDSNINFYFFFAVSICKRYISGTGLFRCNCQRNRHSFPFAPFTGNNLWILNFKSYIIYIFLNFNIDLLWLTRQNLDCTFAYRYVISNSNFACPLFVSCCRSDHRTSRFLPFYNSLRRNSCDLLFRRSPFHFLPGIVYFQLSCVPYIDGNLLFIQLRCRRFDIHRTYCEHQCQKKNKTA